MSRRFVAIDSILALLKQAFVEGVSLQQTAEVADRFMAMAYSNAESTAHTLRIISSFAPGRAHAVALTLHAQKNPTKQSLLQHMQVIAESDVDEVNYYNYGLLNKRQLSWIKEGNAYMISLNNNSFSSISNRRLRLI